MNGVETVKSSLQSIQLQRDAYYRELGATDRFDDSQQMLVGAKRHKLIKKASSGTTDEHLFDVHSLLAEGEDDDASLPALRNTASQKANTDFSFMFKKRTNNARVYVDTALPSPTSEPAESRSSPKALVSHANDTQFLQVNASSASEKPRNINSITLPPLADRPRTHSASPASTRGTALASSKPQT
eukprot:gene25973-32485_t